MIMVLNKVQEEKQQGLVATQQQQQATSAATTGGIGDGGGGERLPLLGITNRGAVAAATTAPSNTNISNVPIQRGVGGGGGGGSIKKTAVNGSSNLASSSSLSKQKARTRQSLRSFRRKGRETTTEFESWRGRIGVHVECDEFKLKELELVLADQLPGWDFVNHYDVLRLWQRPLLPVLIKENSPSVSSFQNQPQTLPVLLLPETREVFIFSFGAVVLFNFPTEQSELEWMQAHLFSSSCDSPAGTSVYGTRHDPRAIESACDDFEFEYGEVFSLKHDICCFMTREPGEKLAVAFALAKSSLLSIYEWTLEQTITRNSHITEHLAKTGNIPMHKEELSIEIGRLFLVKHMVRELLFVLLMLLLIIRHFLFFC
jgi:uncharacterized Rmd1/YagE family protein